MSFARVSALTTALLLAASAAPSGAQSSPCAETWVPTYGTGLDYHVRTLAEYDDGSGPALFAGGDFLNAGGSKVGYVAKQQGAAWVPLGEGMNSGVSSLLVWDDGTGPALYAGGGFSLAGGTPSKGVASWDGTGWTNLGPQVGGYVTSLAVYDDGSGPALYAAGDAVGVSKWNGTTWTYLGFFTGGPIPGFPPLVWDIEVWDDGTGPALYAAGEFTGVDGVSASRVARWDGSSWSALGAGTNHPVFDLAVFDDGTGPALYAGGMFSSAGGAASSAIARWDGLAWSPVGGGFGPTGFAWVFALEATGAGLLAGGDFSSAGGVPASHVARWDGSSWSALGAGLALPTQLAYVYDFIEVDLSAATRLYAAGTFTTSPTGDRYLAAWGCPVAGLPGCGGNPATLAALAAGVPLGSPLPLQITGAAAQSGSGLLYTGVAAVDGAGCGLSLPGFGEVLLAPTPAPSFLAIGLLAGGVCDLSVNVPATPTLSGLTLALQGVAVDLGLAAPIEVTNALVVTLGT